MTGNSAPFIWKEISNSPIKFIHCAMFPENKTENVFSTFHHQEIPRRNSICSVTAWPFMRSKNCFSFFFFFFLRRHLQKVLYPSVILFACFLTANIICICHYFRWLSCPGGYRPPLSTSSISQFDWRLFNQQRQINDWGFRLFDPSKYLTTLKSEM